MRALIVYESMFGNTQTIAQAIADGVREHAQVDLAEVGQAPTSLEPDVDLLVVGGPTHAHGMSRPNTRQSAAGQTTVVSNGIGIREWLATAAPTKAPMAVATFDTRFDKPRWLTGSAARGAARQLRRQGHRVSLPPESFWVLATTGPLAEAEQDRARRWGRQLAEQVATAGTRKSP